MARRSALARFIAGLSGAPAAVAVLLKTSVGALAAPSRFSVKERCTTEKRTEM